MSKLPLDLKGRFEASFDGSWKWFFFIGGISVDNLLIHHDYFEFQNWIGKPDILHRSEIKSLGFVSGQKIFVFVSITLVKSKAFLLRLFLRRIIKRFLVTILNYCLKI